jgi:hypothetical protein
MFHFILFSAYKHWVMHAGWATGLMICREQIFACILVGAGAQWAKIAVCGDNIEVKCCPLALA